MNWDSVSHYEVLQVAPTAPLAVIKGSYKALIQHYHPDRYQPASDAERICKRLNEAYATLSDPDLRAAHDSYLAGSGSRREAPPESRTPPAAPSTDSPERDPDAMGWSGRIAMLIMLFFSGYIGAGLLGGGVIAYMVGAGAGGALFAFGRKRWVSWSGGGKALLIFAWAAVCFGGMVFKQMLINGARTQSIAAAGPAVSLANDVPVADPAPPSGFVLDAPSPQRADPRDSYLQLHVDQLNDNQYSAAVDRWLESHPELQSSESMRVMSELLQQVYSQYPRSALGPALDMALQRGLKAGAQEEAQRMAQTAASRAEAYSPSRAATPVEGPSAVPLPTYRPAPEPTTYPTQAQMDARRKEARAAVEEASKGGLSGAYKRYDYKSGRDIWVDASGNPLE